MVASSSLDHAAIFADLFAHLFLLGVAINEADRAPPPAVGAQPPPPSPEEPPNSVEQETHAQYDGWDRPRRRVRDAREGLLFSFGVGGGSMLVSPLGRAGGLQGNLRLGYGFSDRFQFFFDFTGAGVDYGNDTSASTWMGTIRGQTVLIGDRRGNGLNINFGIGLAGTMRSYNGFDDNSPRTGLALAGGISYDARVGRNFSLSPEFFVWWHAIPNGRGQDNDVASAAGLQLNFLWYGP